MLTHKTERSLASIVLEKSLSYFQKVRNLILWCQKLSISISLDRAENHAMKLTGQFGGYGKYGMAFI